MNEEQLIQPENTVARLKLVYYERSGWKLNRYVWENPSESEMEFSIGTRVWPAGEDEKTSFIVKAIKAPGEKFYPEGGVVCASSSADRTFFPDAVIKHPAEEKTTKRKKSK